MVYIKRWIKIDIHWMIVTLSIIPLIILSFFFIKAIFMVNGTDGFLAPLKPFLNVWHQNELLKEAWLVSADKNPVVAWPIIGAYLLWLGVTISSLTSFRNINIFRNALIIVIILLFPSLIYLYSELIHYPSYFLILIPLAFPMTALIFIFVHQWRITEAKVVPIGHASAGKTLTLLATFHAIKRMDSPDLDMKFYKKGVKEELEDDTVAMADVSDKIGNMLKIIDDYEYRNKKLDLYYGGQVAATHHLERLNFQISKKRRFLPEVKLRIASADYGGEILFRALVKQDKGEYLTDEEINIIETTTNAEALILFIDPVLACPDLIKKNYEGKIPYGILMMAENLKKAGINNIDGVLVWYRALVDRAIKKRLKCIAIVIPKLDIIMDPEELLRGKVTRNVKSDAENLIMNDSIRSNFYKYLQAKLPKNNVKIFPMWVVSQPYTGQKAKNINQGILLPIIQKTGDYNPKLMIGGQIEMMEWLMEKLLET